MANTRQSENGKKHSRNILLMKLSAAGDRNAFRDLVDSNNPWMRAVLTYRLHDEELAKDESQEIWIKIWDNLEHHRYTDEGKPEAWITSCSSMS